MIVLLICRQVAGFNVMGKLAGATPACVEGASATEWQTPPPTTPNSNRNPVSTLHKIRTTPFAQGAF